MYETGSDAGRLQARPCCFKELEFQQAIEDPSDRIERRRKELLTPNSVRQMRYQAVAADIEDFPQIPAKQVQRTTTTVKILDTNFPSPSVRPGGVSA